ncbi:alcohol dehydrogenase catalytic domain-containing protein [Streptomyces collinus]
MGRGSFRIAWGRGPAPAIVKITTTNICGSDLHMYEGRTSFESGRPLGHENLGQVVEVGSAVRKVQVGEYVVLPFNIACGLRKQCEQGLTNYCLTMQPEPAVVSGPGFFSDMCHTSVSPPETDDLASAVRG